MAHRKGTSAFAHHAAVISPMVARLLVSDACTQHCHNPLIICDHSLGGLATEITMSIAANKPQRPYGTLAITLIAGALAIALSAHGRQFEAEVYYWLLQRMGLMDLWEEAISEDLHGRTQAATEKIKQYVHSREFASLSFSSQCAWRHVAYTRNHCNDPDYFRQLVCANIDLESMGLHPASIWELKHVPIAVYIPMEPKPEGFTHLQREKIIDCLDQWCKATDRKLRFKFTEKPEEAKISFHRHRINELSGQTEKTYANDKLPLRLIERATIDLDPVLDMRAFCSVCLHEIGHALGIGTHSSNTQDAMFSSSTNITLSPRDRATIHRLYGSDAQRDARRLISEALASGEPIEQLTMGVRSEFGEGTSQDLPQAVQLYERAAAEGIPAAQLRLAGMYMGGGGTAPNFDKAFQWARKSADQGYPLANHILGLCYESGLGTRQDPEAAFKFYKKAAEAGMPLAQGCLASMYQRGHGCSRDVKCAISWYVKAFAQGQSAAAHKLAQIHRYGAGVPVDQRKANYWQEKACMYVHARKAASAEEYHDRGSEWLDIGEATNALSDLSRALDSHYQERLDARYDRARAFLRLGRSDAALQDLNLVVRLGGKFPNCAHCLRGLAHSSMGDYSRAMSDYQRAIELSKSDRRRLTAAYIEWALASAFQSRERALSILQEAETRVSDRSWPYPVINYLLAKTSRQSLLAEAAKDPERINQARTYLGVWLAASGKVDEAKRELEWVKDKDETSVYRALAMSQLKRLSH